MATRAGPKARVHAHTNKNSRIRCDSTGQDGDHDDVRLMAADIEG